MLLILNPKTLLSSPRSAALPPLRDRRNATGVAKHCGTTVRVAAGRGAWTKPCPASCPGSSRRRSACCPWRRRDWRGSCRRRSGGSGGRRGGPSRSASTSSASSACSQRPWSLSGRGFKLLRRCPLRRPVYRRPRVPPPPRRLCPSLPREPSRPDPFLLRRRWDPPCLPMTSPVKRRGRRHPQLQNWRSAAGTCLTAATASGSSKASSRRASSSTRWTSTTKQTILT